MWCQAAESEGCEWEEGREVAGIGRGSRGNTLCVCQQQQSATGTPPAPIAAVLHRAVTCYIPPRLMVSSIHLVLDESGRRAEPKQN